MAIFSLCSETDKTNEEENKYVVDVFKKLNNKEKIRGIDFSKVNEKDEFLNVVLATNDSTLIKEVIEVFKEKKYFEEISNSRFRTLLKDTKNIDMVKKLLDIYKDQNPEEFKNLITDKFNLKNFLEPLILANDTKRINVVLEVIKNSSFEIKEDITNSTLNLLKLAIKQENMEIFNNMIGAFENKSFEYEAKIGGSVERDGLKNFLLLANGYQSLIDEAEKTSNAYVMKTVKEKLNEIKNGKKEELGEKAENNEDKINDNDIADNSSNNPNSDNNTNKEEQSEENTDIISLNNNNNSDSAEISEEAESLEQLITDLTALNKLGKKREKEKNVLVYKKERELINRYNLYVKNNKELKLKTIKIKEKNKYFNKKNYYVYIKAKKLDSAIEALKGQQSGVDFDINGMWL